MLEVVRFRNSTQVVLSKKEDNCLCNWEARWGRTQVPR